MACAKSVVYAWELKPILFKGDPGKTDSGMDLINDDIGLELGGNKDGICYNECKKKLKNGELINLD